MLKRVTEILPSRVIKVAGINVMIGNDNNLLINALILSNAKGKIDIEQQYDNINDLNELFEQITPNIPLVLNIDGKGIIHKKIVSKDREDATLINQVFPNANTDDFYIQKSSVNDEEVYISLVRKENILSILDEISKRKFYLLALYLGPFALTRIIDLLTTGNEINTAGYKISFNEFTIVNLTKLPQDSEEMAVEIDNTNISSTQIVPFSACLEYLLPHIDNIENNIEDLDEQKEEYKYRNAFFMVGKGALVFFLLILLINYLIFSSLNKKNSLLSQEYNNSINLITQIETLNSTLAQKKEFISKTGFKNAGKISYYADRIGMLIPESVRLTRLDLNPLQKKYKEGEEVNFEYNKIRISGVSSNVISFNEMMKLIKDEVWVQSAEILSYNQEDLKSVGIFEIEIVLEK